MEIIAMTQEGVLVAKPGASQVKTIRYQDIDDHHTLIRDVISFKLGYLVAIHRMESANDE